MKWSPKLRDAVAGDDAVPAASAARVIRSALERADDYAASIAAAAIGRGATEPLLAGSATAGLRMILLKPVGDRCNLACRYCYETERRQGTSTRSMDVNTLDRVLDNLLPHVEQPFSVAIHGGEPLLARRQFFDRLVERLKAHDPVSISVQTNGVLIDDDWAEWFRVNRVAVGLSLDGPTQRDNAARILRSGEGSFSAVLRAMSTLRRHNVRFNVIAVIAPPRAARTGEAGKLFAGFRKLEIRNYDVHPAYTPTAIASDSNLAPVAYANFMTELFDTWVDSDDEEVRIGTFEQFFQSMTGLPANACYRAGKCTSILGIDPDGETSPCTRPFHHRHRFGNLAKIPVEAVLSSPEYRRFAEREASGQACTNGCRWSSICGRGGCPHERLENGRQAIGGKHIYCTCHDATPGGYPALFRHIHAVVEREMFRRTSAWVR